MTPATLLCIDVLPEPSLRAAQDQLASLGHLHWAEDLTAAAAGLRQTDWSMVLAAMDLAATGVHALLSDFRAHSPSTPVVLAAPPTDLARVVDALQSGLITRYLATPVQTVPLLAAAREALHARARQADDMRARAELERIHAELDERVRELDEANELLEYWVEFSPAVLYSLSCENGHLHPSYVGKNYHRLTGYERTTAVVDADFWPGLIHPADLARYRETLLALAGPERGFAVLEYRVRHRDGSYLRVVDSLRAVRDGEGRTVEVVGAWLDVSARDAGA
ncbi:MAG: PAS domain-containing protein [Gammaproteobacteria bacterium]